MKLFNINDYVWIKLTSKGQEFLLNKEKSLTDKFNHDFSGLYTNKEKDTEGYSQWQLWELMNVFGEQLQIGIKGLLFETTIKIPETGQNR